MSEQASNTAVANQPKRRIRATRTGVVMADARHKTIKVLIEFQVKHDKYNKFLSRRTVLHVHDEKSECAAGDKVEVMECRPLSKTKHWRLVRVVTRAPRKAGAV